MGEGTAAPQREGAGQGGNEHHNLQCRDQRLRKAPARMALQLLWAMGHGRVKKDTITYSAAISACEKG